MSDLMTLIYEYAYKHRIAAYLMDEEYEKGEKHLERLEAELRSAIPERNVTRFSDYCEEISIQHTVEQQAAFQAGFAIALEILRP